MPSFSSANSAGFLVEGILNSTRCRPVTAPGTGAMPMVVNENDPSSPTVPRASRPGLAVFSACRFGIVDGMERHHASAAGLP